MMLDMELELLELDEEEWLTELLLLMPLLLLLLIPKERWWLWYRRWFKNEVAVLGVGQESQVVMTPKKMMSGKKKKTDQTRLPSLSSLTVSTDTHVTREMTQDKRRGWHSWWPGTEDDDQQSRDNKGSRPGVESRERKVKTLLLPSSSSPDALLVVSLLVSLPAAERPASSSPGSHSCSHGYSSIFSSNFSSNQTSRQWTEWNKRNCFDSFWGEPLLLFCSDAEVRNKSQEQENLRIWLSWWSCSDGEVKLLFPFYSLYFGFILPGLSFVSSKHFSSKWVTSISLTRVDF